MFSWLGRSKRTRQILNDMYGTAQRMQTERAKKEIERYKFVLEQQTKT
jgi:hypothetical protein